MHSDAILLNSDTSYPLWIIEALYALGEYTGNSPLSQHILVHL